MKVLVLTTSYPRYEGDSTVNFLGEAVSCLRERGLDVDVVSPLDFRHYGIAYGSGVMGNLRRRPWLAAMVPPMLWNFRAEARRRADGVDLVHAHWLPTGLVAAGVGKPFVL
jgi:glycosyltransferase involved in cell wall biosynthesis